MFGLVLAACSSNDKTEDPNIFPDKYRQEVLDTLSSALPDITNVRDAFISEPTITPIGKVPRYTVCVRYNARNVNREYMGSKDRIGIFYGGHLNQLVEAEGDQCAKAAYKPFPELEKICLATKCS
jgi:hypothetical protein